MENLSLELPINSLSFGNCSVNLLKEFFAKKLNVNLFLIGDKADISSFDNLERSFLSWLDSSASKASILHDRKNPALKFWHINGSLSSVSKEQYLFTFYELDSPTLQEVNILKNQEKVFVSSSFTKEVFENFGLKNIVHCPLGFDSSSFFRLNEPQQTDKTVFGLVGKLEKRKQHHKVIKAWLKKYGNNPKYLLNCAIFNPFIDPNQQINAIRSLFEGKDYFNVNILPFMSKNSEYNHYLNSNDIIIGMSGGEGWGLPEFQSLCIGKHGVILNAHAYKDWADKDNAVLVEPNGKFDSHDGVFFHKGSPFNQGSFFDWKEEDFLNACEEAEKRYSSNPVNEKGLELVEKFSWNKTANNILANIS